MESPASNKRHKIVMVGDSGVGLNSLRNRFVHSSFTHNTEICIGAEFSRKVVITRCQREVTIDIIQLAGQDKTRSMLHHFSFLRGAGVLVGCDISHPTSLDYAVRWKKSIDSYVDRDSECSPIPCLLLVNKCDLDDELHKNPAEMDHFCKEHGFMDWMKTSAKDNVNVDAAFNTLVDRILENASCADVIFDPEASARKLVEGLETAERENIEKALKPHIGRFYTMMELLKNCADGEAGAREALAVFEATERQTLGEGLGFAGEAFRKH